jgi:hypothetical protein
MVAVSTDEHGRVLEDPPYGRYLDGPAMHALDVNATWKMRITQRLPRLIIPSNAFDAMLVGCCAVRCSSYVLARRLDPDVLAVIESFASSAVISSGAAAALQEATEEFATRLFQDVILVALHRKSFCVHAGDVDAAIDLTGAYQLVGRRRVSGDLCASCIKPDGPATLSTISPAPDPEGHRTRPDPPRSRPSLTWCEKAPLDGSGPRSAIRRSLKILAVRANSPHLAPGALDAVASACVGFCRTVLTKARGGDSEVLRSIAAEDRRVATLRDVLAAQYDALHEAGEADWQDSPWSGDELDAESVESESSLQQREWHRERRSSGGAQTRAMRAAATDWSSDDEEDDEEGETAGAYDGLTSRAVEDALNYLGCRVYGAVDRAEAEPGDAFELAAAIPPAVLANAVDVEPDILAFDFARLISGLGPPPADAELRRAVFVSRCPDCGTTCVAFRLDYAYNDDRTEVVFAQSHDVSSADELRSLETSPGWAGRTGLDIVRYYDGGSTFELESMNIVGFDDTRVPPSFRAAAREAGLRSMQWPGNGEPPDWVTVHGRWFNQLLPLIMAARDASSGFPFLEVGYDEPRIRFVHVLHAIILVLEEAPRRLFPIDLSLVDGLVRPDGSVETDVNAIKQRLGVSQTEDIIDFQGISARSPSILKQVPIRAMKLSKPDAMLNFDDDAAQLLSWFLKRRLVETFALARRVPHSVLCPHTGNGGVLTLNTFSFARRLYAENSICLLA